MNVGYCTNIHSGTSLDEVIGNLQRFAVPIKQAVSPERPMGIGLWLSREAIREAETLKAWRRLKDFLDQHGLVAHTFNAFPFANFHAAEVKHRVYEPDWSTEERRDYTVDVCRLLCRLLPEGCRGSVSTLPLGWPHEDPPGAAEVDRVAACAANIRQCAEMLMQLQDENHREVVLCLEPESGCLLQTSQQVVDFFYRDLAMGAEPSRSLRNHVAVCHDICHAAVMFEEQAAVLNRYREHDIAVGKVQISSAVQSEPARFPQQSGDLERFVEPRYLHQTCVEAGEILWEFEDLPAALQRHSNHSLEGLWRTHFHVPIHLSAVGSLSTTQSEIGACLDWFQQGQYPTHFEVETYAWEVSPDSVKSGSLVDAVAAELNWLNHNHPGLASLNQV